MAECGSLGLLVSSGGTVRASVSSHLRRFIMKKKLNHGATKRNTVKTTEDKRTEETDNRPTANSLDDEEQGFGGWLKSPDGFETMKLLNIIANSIVMLTTIVYPHIQNVYGILSDMFYGDDVFE